MDNSLDSLTITIHGDIVNVKNLNFSKINFKKSDWISHSIRNLNIIPLIRIII